MMTVVDARKLLETMNVLCKGLAFTKKEVTEISLICLKTIERLEMESANE